MLTRKIAFIDLTKRTVTKREIPLEWRQKYLGARGINGYLLFSLVKPPYDPFAPENPLIFGAGMLTGLPGFGTGRYNVSAISPVSGNLGDANSGGHFGPALKFAGFDHLVITGKSDTPVYILVHNDNIQIRDARHLWGKDTWETQKTIKKENGDDRIQVATMGIAGENLVRFAHVITGPKASAGRGGMGAVMGSKKLKAVAVRGTKDVNIAHPKELLAYFKEENTKLLGTKWIQAFRRFGTPILLNLFNEGGWFYARDGLAPPLGAKLRSNYAENLDRYTLGMAGCFGCTVQCRHRHLISQGRFAGTRGEGPEFASTGPFMGWLEVLDIEAAIYSAHLCNLLGLDIASTGNMIRFAMHLYEQGIITKADTGGLEVKWGNADAVLTLIGDIANKKGFLGELLAEGPYALKKLPPEAARYLPLTKNAIPLASPAERLVKGWALASAVSPIGHRHRCDSGLEMLGLPTDALQKLYGGFVASHYKDYEGKSLQVWWHESLHTISDSLGCCRFLERFSTPRGPAFEEFSSLIWLASGLNIPAEKLKMEVAQRIFTTERLLLKKLGVSGRKADMLPELYFVPLVGGQWAGDAIDRTKFEELLDQYYSLHGWDENSIPRPEQVERLQISEAKL